MAAMQRCILFILIAVLSGSAALSVELSAKEKQALSTVVEILERIEQEPNVLRSLKSSLQKAIVEQDQQIKNLQTRINAIAQELDRIEQKNQKSESHEIAQPAAPSGDIDFERDVFPILEARCTFCHGPSQPGGQLRLDAKSLALKGGMSGPAVAPGNLEKSQLYRRIMGMDDKPTMPMGDDPLLPAQIETIRVWIESGAEWPDHIGEQAAELETHWSYVKPQKPETPSVKNADWISNPIDAFVLSRLEKEGIAPSPQADKQTLIRRLYLDIIGIPPSPDEIDAFIADPNQDAYETVVERLLASPHYGEKWAKQWLDLARYADSNGYQIDKGRTMWPYRDWVINALNDNKPFDEFTIEQIAGDLLPNPTLGQLVATGFHRNTMVNEEGGVDQEEYRIEAVHDRTGTTAAVWLGATMACAQCHNHKFDPFSQKEYYQLFAFFNNTEEEVERRSAFEAHSNGPLVNVPNADQQRVIDEISPELNALKSLLYADTNELALAQTAWEKSLRDSSPDWTILKPISFNAVSGATHEVETDHSIFVGGISPATDEYMVRGLVSQDRVTAIRLEALADGRLPKGGPGRANHANFALSEIHVSMRSLDSGEFAPIALARPSASHEPDTFPAANALDNDPKTSWAIQPRYGESHEAVFELETPLHLDGEVELKVDINQSHGSQHTLGRFRFSTASRAQPVKALSIPRLVFDAAAKPSAIRDATESALLKSHFRETAPAFQTLRDRIAALEKRWPKNIPTTLVMKEIKTPRETNVFIGGSFLNRGEPVFPSVPAVLNELPSEQPTRLDLAQWLVSEDNPLTARVTVNRIWEQYFGTGIVKTTEDLGTKGETPFHPELLDWLAVEFMESGWDMKAMHRLIVASSTYRQSSNVTQDQHGRDPNNRLLARGSRLRLDAELIRDAALSAAGLLNKTIGGPSVFPFQPDGIWRMPYNSETWQENSNADRFRRGLYVHRRRTATYPTFINFDSPTREITCSRRTRTNTPLQALNLLNDPAYFEAAQGLARRIMREGDPALPRKIILGFRLCASRYPTQDEIKRLAALYQKQILHFNENPRAAKEVACGSKSLSCDGFDMTELAAWTMVSNVLLNLDETITKG